MLAYNGFSRARNHVGEASAIIAAEERADRATSKLERIKAKGDAATHAIVHKGITAGVAGGLGAWQGYKGAMPELLGFGADLWIGAAFSLGALMADEIGLGKYNTYLDAVGTGALTFWAANQGNMWGVAKAEKENPGMYPGEAKGGFAISPNNPDGTPKPVVAGAGGYGQFAPHMPGMVNTAQPDGVPWGITR